MRLGKDGIIITDDFDVELQRISPEIDECKTILLHVVKQAVDDYQAFKNSERPEHIEIWESANTFLFSDDHYIDWGDRQFNLEEICEFMGLEIHWVRRRIQRQLGIEIKPDGVMYI